MAAYIAIFLSLISIILLIYVIVRFKKLFSTDAIIEKTKVQMNKIISDINKNANMDIDLINDATKRTRTLMSDADEKMAELKEATSLLRDMIATVENGSKMKINQGQIYGKSNSGDDLKSGVYNVSSDYNNENNQNVNKRINVGGYTSTASAYRARAYQATQYKDAFDDNDLLDNKVEAESVSEHIQQNEVNQAEVNMIPKIVTNIIPDEAGSSRKSLNEKVERLFRAGMQVDDIAIELSCSSSEVQFIIDMMAQPTTGM